MSNWRTIRKRVGVGEFIGVGVKGGVEWSGVGITPDGVGVIGRRD